MEVAFSSRSDAPSCRGGGLGSTTASASAYVHLAGTFPALPVTNCSQNDSSLDAGTPDAAAHLECRHQATEVRNGPSAAKHSGGVMDMEWPPPPPAMSMLGLQLRV